MKLEQLLNIYKTERYKLYSDVYKNDKVSGVLGFTTYAEYFDNYLGYFKTIDDTEKLIGYAVKGLFEYKGKLYMHPHQKQFRDRGGNQQGISNEVGEEVINN